MRNPKDAIEAKRIVELTSTVPGTDQPTRYASDENLTLEEKARRERLIHDGNCPCVLHKWMLTWCICGHNPVATPDKTADELRAEWKEQGFEDIQFDLMQTTRSNEPIIKSDPQIGVPWELVPLDQLIDDIAIAIGINGNPGVPLLTKLVERVRAEERQAKQIPTIAEESARGREAWFKGGPGATYIRKDLLSEPIINPKVRVWFDKHLTGWFNPDDQADVREKAEAIKDLNALVQQTNERRGPLRHLDGSLVDPLRGTQEQERTWLDLFQADNREMSGIIAELQDQLDQRVDIICECGNPARFCGECIENGVSKRREDPLDWNCGGCATPLKNHRFTYLHGPPTLDCPTRINKAIKCNWAGCDDTTCPCDDGSFIGPYALRRQRELQEAKSIQKSADKIHKIAIQAAQSLPQTPVSKLTKLKHFVCSPTLWKYIVWTILGGAITMLLAVLYTAGIIIPLVWHTLKH